MTQNQPGKTELHLSKERPIHLIGGGGVGMSALGLLLLSQGYELSASDLNGGVYLEKLQEKGARTWVGSDFEKIVPEALIFYSSAISPDDPERKGAAGRGQEAHPRHLLLRSLTRDFYTIAVSGTHGKTTTSAWIAFLFEKAGRDPSALIGGTLAQWGSHFRIGRGEQNNQPLLIMEADESDGSFLQIDADEALITNVELDHVDRYDAENEIFDQFHTFIEQCQKKGGLTLPSPEAKNWLPENAPYARELERFFETLEYGPDFISFENAWGSGEKVQMQVSLPGRHNLYNGALVAASGLIHSIELEVIQQALSGFTGVGRRLETLAKIKNSHGAEITIIDDYAHHPSEVRAVLDVFAPSKSRVVAIWEPHRISRFCHFYHEFIEVLEKFPGFQNTALLPVFDAGGEASSGEFTEFAGLWEELAKRLMGEYALNEAPSEMARLAQEAKSDTTFLFMGAGRSSAVAHECADLLASQKD